MLRFALPILLLAAAPAHAQWSPPQPVPGAQGGHSPGVTITATGTRHVAWSTWDPFEVVGVHLDGRTVSDFAYDSTGPVTYGRSRVALAWTDNDLRRVYAWLGGPVSVGTGRDVHDPVLAGNARGKLALAWFDDRGTRDDEVMVAVRRPGEAFGRPRRIARGPVRGVSVAVGPRGHVLVAWNTPGRVHARILGGRGETIRSREAHAARLHTAVLDGGAVVAWTAKFRSEGGDARDTFVQAATRGFGERRFRRAQLLARHDGPESEVRVEGELGALAWSTPDGLFHTYMEDGTYVRPAVRSAPAGAQLQDLDGLAAAYLLDGRLHVSGDPVSGPGAADADLASDPRTGRPTAVWVQDGRVMTASRG